MISLEGKSAFFFCANYGNKGPRVLLLSGGRWTASMVAHCGVSETPFFTRDKRESEPDTYPNGHPWGWVYKLEDVVKDECRFLDKETLEIFEQSMGDAVKKHTQNQEEMCT